MKNKAGSSKTGLNIETGPSFQKVSDLNNVTIGPQLGNLLFCTGNITAPIVIWVAVMLRCRIWL